MPGAGVPEVAGASAEGVQVALVAWYQRKYCKFIDCGVLAAGGFAQPAVAANTWRLMIGIIG